MTTNQQNSDSNSNNGKKLFYTKIPPDGGWGWIIVIGYSLFNLILLPMLTNFCLIYKDKINAIDLTAAEISVIFNFNSAFGLSLGLIANKMLRLFGCRVVACISGFVFVLGTGFTALANSFWTFFLTYSIISAFGYGFGTTSFSMSMNRYFIKNRNKAAGIAMTVTGIGPIIYPPLIVILNEIYGVNGCILILSAISAHMIVAAFLLQPVRWHLIRQHPLSEHQNIENNDKTITPAAANKIDRKKSSASEFSDDDMVELPTNLNKSDYFMIHHNVYGTYEPIPIRRKFSLPTDQLSYDSSSIDFDELTRVKSIDSIYDFKETATRRWFESGSLDSIHLGSSLQIFNEKFYNVAAGAGAAAVSSSGANRRESRRPSMHVTSLKMVREESDNLNEINEDEQQQLEETSKNFMQLEQITENNNNKNNLLTTPSITTETNYSLAKKWFRKNVDITLLKDKVYLNIMIGVSLAGFAEFNFIVFTPILLDEMKFGSVQICSVMSIIGSTDILFRFVAPFVGDYFHQPPRIMFMITLLLLIASRMAILYVSSYAGVLIVGAAIGIARGVRTVYWNLVIPNYVPIEQLSSATTIQIICNGIILVVLGPIVGCLVDITGSYTICVIALNLITFITVVIWIFEMYIYKMLK